ncbi:MAG TPA: hypothetical protein VG326_03910 [Tepidisphaeraceae bacterium]|jgi:hypothetical protein|nr:hypothetical protein [Tepidisphaeraceae bacterium]
MRRVLKTNLVLASAVAGMMWGWPLALGQVKPPEAKEKPAGDQQSVPVKEVVLYTSGVGYFEHFGSIKGNGFTELHFKTQQINDILKSLLLEDLDGGKVASVTYGSQEPLSHTLKSFQVDLSAAPSLNELLSQLRGASVTAIVPQGAVTGVILSVEKKQKPSGEKTVIDVWTLNLLLPGGSIRPVELDQVSEIKLDDAKLQQELVKALSAVAAARDQDSKPVAIRFSGQGERRVRIGYVVEAPVWKASYRLVLTEDAKNDPVPATQPADLKARDPKASEKNDGGKLQGWAIVENQTDGDWENVQLSLVSGRPISFIEDLYQPLYVTRPVVEPELYASLRPQRYVEGMNNQAMEQAKQNAMQQNAAGFRRQSAGQDGAFARNRGLDSDKFAFLGEGRKDLAGANAPINATASVDAQASGASVGEFFQYTVGDVSLPRQKSAMIPIIADLVKTTRLSIFNAATLPDHPLLGARLTNTTGKLLPQGPITVLDGGAYAGDATIEDLPNTQSRLLSYGIDQSILVHDNDRTEDASLVTAKVVKGVLELTSKRIAIQHYAAQNKGKTDRTLLIEHPKHPGWKLIQPVHASETTDTLYRIEENLPAGRTKNLLVQEEVVGQRGFAILPMDTSQIEMYLRTGPIPDEVKKALQQAAKLKYAQVETQRQEKDREQTINDITQEQNRIRENMKAVSAASDYYKRLEKELDAQETQLQKLKQDVKDLKAKSDQQRKDLEEYLQNLSVG